MSQQDEQAERTVGAFTITGPPAPSGAGTRTAPEPDETWQLPGGTAHVFHGQGNNGIVRPVIISDGFGLGPSDLGWLHAHLEDGDFPLVTELRQRGRDVILVGYHERAASLLDNADAVVTCIQRAQVEQLSVTPLVVGGFSMGGLLTRYALAYMETQHIDHRTGVYFSFDSPHRGAVIPVGLQAFAHFIPLANDFARQMDSPAARQMLWRHYDPKTGEVGTAPERTEFLQALDSVGGWPRVPRLIGVASGRGDGTGLPLTPGDVTLTVGKLFPGTTFHAQAQGEDTVVAELKRRVPKATKTVTTSGFPELDGAPGGTLRSFGILADALRDKGAEVDLRHERVCFVPTVSAVAIRDLDDQKDLYTDIYNLPPQDSDLDDFRCSSDTTEHTTVTPELGHWLLDRLTD